MGQRLHVLRRITGALAALVLAMSLLSGVLLLAPAALAADITTSTCPTLANYQNVMTNGGTLSYNGSSPCSLTLSDALKVASGVSVSIDGGNAGLTLTNTNYAATLINARSLSSGQSLTLDHVTLATGSSGYGISAYQAGGAISLTNSTLTGGAYSEGIDAYQTSGPISLTNSTISGTGDGSLGIVTLGETGGISLTNSTISTSTTGYYGFGIEAGDIGGAITVTNSTINTGDYGNGVYEYNVSGVITVTSSIIAGGIGSYNCSSSFSDGGYNLSASPDGTENSCGFASSTTGSRNVTTADLNVQPLADNGGPTKTMALGPGSVAIDAIPVDSGQCSVGEQADQRGVARPQGTGCDAGAFETESQITPVLTFDLSTLPAKTYGDAPFGIASYASSTNSATPITFTTGNGSQGCDVTTDGTVTLTGAGTCTLVASQAAGDGYTAATTTVTALVNPAALTITASSPTITSGDAVPAITPSYQGFVNGDSASSTGFTPPTCTTTYTTGGLAGNYATSCAGANDANYTISYVGGTLTANPPAGSTLLTIRLVDHNGDLITEDNGTASYYHQGWHTIGVTANGVIQITLPSGKYSFAMEYEGTREQRDGVTVSGATSSLTFQTALVTAALENSAGQPLDIGKASYYAQGWHTIGTTTNGMVNVEMLPGSYSFAMTYNGTREQLNAVNISQTPAVTFQTVAVTLELRDHNGALIADQNGTGSYYAQGWHSVGDTTQGTSSVELLPGSYSFAMEYLGTRAQLNAQAVSVGDSTVTFQTGEVDSSTATGYYAQGWRSFTTGMELLPGTYTFSFSGAPNQKYIVVGGTINTIS